MSHVSKEFADHYDLRCHCDACGWEEDLDIHNIDYNWEREVADEMICKECGHVGLMLSAVVKGKRVMLNEELNKPD